MWLKKLIQEQRLEISGVSDTSWRTSPWERLSLVNDEEVTNLSKAKVCVFSGSVLCLGKVRQFPESNEDWKAKTNWFLGVKQYRELDRIDGEPMEFEWMIFPGFTKLQILHEIQKFMKTLGCEPESSSCRCTTTSYGEIRKRTSMSCQFDPCG